MWQWSLRNYEHRTARKTTNMGIGGNAPGIGARRLPIGLGAIPEAVNG